MGAIEKYIKNHAAKVIEKIPSFNETIKSSLVRVQGYVGTAIEVNKNGETFMGLQYSAIPVIRVAIRTYVSNIQNELSNLHTIFLNSNSLNGDIAVSVKKYVDAVSKVVDVYASSLLIYSDKMYKYGEVCKTSNFIVESDVDDDIQDFTGIDEIYVEQN